MAISIKTENKLVFDNTKMYIKFKLKNGDTGTINMDESSYFLFLDDLDKDDLQAVLDIEWENVVECKFLGELC